MSNVLTAVQEYQDLYPEDFSTGSTSEEIEQSEKILNVQFSEEYKKFILKYGAAGIEAHFIYGFKHLPLMGKQHWTVTDKTLFYKETQKWPEIDNWYIISEDGRGNPIGCKPDGSVWLSDHDAGFEQTKLADSLEEFLHKLLTDTLYE